MRDLLDRNQYTMENQTSEIEKRELEQQQKCKFLENEIEYLKSQIEEQMLKYDKLIENLDSKEIELARLQKENENLGKQKSSGTDKILEY